MLVQELAERKLVTPPKWLPSNVHYLVIMGSVAYGVSSDNSDQDIYGFAIPPKEDVFPHLRGEIPGFGRQKQRFQQWQEHHVHDPDAAGGKGTEYDFTVYSIVKYFQLCMENNPNMVDSLFVPERCVKHISAVGKMVREKRRIFLHRGCWQKFKGYAYSQLSKIQTKRKTAVVLRQIEEQLGIPHEITFDQVEAEVLFRQDSPGMVSGAILSNLSSAVLEAYYRTYKKGVEKSKRFEGVKHGGYDFKFAYHLVRLMCEVEQILVEGDLDIQKNREQLKSIRRGEWELDRLISWFENKEKVLDKVYVESKLPWGPDEAAIKQLLLDCLEHHYGSLDKMQFHREDEAVEALRQVARLVEKWS